jgi:hypothetical protein
MPIECKTKFTKESFRKMQYYASFGESTGKKILAGCLIVMLIVGLLIMALSVADGYFSGIRYGVLVIACALFGLMMPRITTYSVFKSNPAVLEVGIAYSFFDDHFVAITAGDLINSTDDMKYGILFKVTETKDYFYLYLLQMPSFYISKDGFTSGTPEELSALFAKVLPPKKFVKKVK